MNSLEHSIPFLYGSTATPFCLTEEKNPQNTHRWVVYVRGIGGEDLSKYISHIEFILHESFQNPKRKITKPPFEVSESGWGEFEIIIKIFCIDQPEDAFFVLTHYLQLYDKRRNPFTKEEELGELKIVRSEFYDEIVLITPSLSDNNIKEEFTADDENMKKFYQSENKTLKKIQNLIDKQNKNLKK